jgi:hypothetical protein
MARLTNADGNSWRPQDTISRLSDGTSNQILIGEKHIPLGAMGTCANDDDGAVNAGNATGWADCSILTTGERRTPGSVRVVRNRFALWNQNLMPGIVLPKMKTNAHYQNGAFGSYHPGVCNFAVGDGAVKGLSATILPEALAQLGQVNDGVAVSF